MGTVTREREVHEPASGPEAAACGTVGTCVGHSQMTPCTATGTVNPLAAERADLDRGSCLLGELSGPGPDCTMHAACGL